MFLMKECTQQNKMYGTLMKSNLQIVLHTAKKDSMYSVHAGFAFYTLFLSRICLEFMLKKVFFRVAQITNFLTSL